MRPRAAVGVVMVDDGLCEVLIGTTATAHLLKSCVCSCGGVSNVACDNPYIDVSGAMSDYAVPRRDQRTELISLKRGEILVFADRLVHAGFAASSTRNRHIFAALPFADKESILDNEVVPIGNTYGPEPKHFDGSLVEK